MLNKFLILFLCVALSGCGYSQKKPSHMINAGASVGLSLLSIPAGIIGGGFLFNSIYSNSVDTTKNEEKDGGNN